MKVLLVDMGAKLPSLALMRLSTFHKGQGRTVALMNYGDTHLNPAKFDQIYLSVIFTRDRHEAEKFLAIYGNKVQVGGPGWDFTTRLPEDVEKCRPDYHLYTPEILYPRLNGPYTRENRMAKAKAVAMSGLGRTSTGCVRRCGFCIVPKSEGDLRQADRLEDLVSPHSKVVQLLDNNLSADPFGIDKLKQAQEMGLILNITQGIDIRASSDEFLQTLCQTDLWGSTIYFAWDRMQDEKKVIEGINQIKPIAAYYKKELTCFCLVAFDSTIDQDIYRIRTLKGLNVRPYIMPINQADRADKRMACLKRWANMFFYRRMEFSEYEPWKKIRDEYQQGLFSAA